MRILVFNWRDVTHPSGGGAEVYVESVLTSLAASGHQVTLFCAAHPGAPHTERKVGSEFSGYDIVRAGSRLGVYRAARTFYAEQGRGSFDLVIDSTNTRPFFAHEFVSDAPVAVLCYQVAREIWSHEAPWPVSVLGRYLLEPRWLHRLRSARVLTISESSKRSLESYGVPVAAVVPMGMELPPGLLAEAEQFAATNLLSPQSDEPVAVFCARLVSSKRPDAALAAFAAARTRLGTGRLWVLGSGPLEEKLRASHPAGVEFLGRVSQAEKFARFRAADMLLATSVREGWGLTVSEAAAVGTPSLAYDVPGLCDSVAAAAGVLVAPNPTALADAMVELLPAWNASPPAVPLSGGTVSWDVVASALVAAALDRPAAHTPSR